jgi:bifunctional non-homologous end joining protein LigD
MRPMLASATPDAGEAAHRVPAGPQWLHEVKWDGMRVLADIHEGALRLSARSESTVTVSFPELAGLADAVPDALLDGEVVALDQGVPSFTALAERMHVQDRRRAEQLAASRPVVLMVFDVLRLYGVSLLDRPLQERRATLERLGLDGAHWQVPPAYDDGAALLLATQEQGLEGVVSKRRDSTYQPGRRSKDWVKIPNRHVQSCLVGGWRPEVGSQRRLGALLLGVREESGQLTFAGRVGSGISGRAQTELTDLLAPHARPTSPFDPAVPRADAVGSTWCEPVVVVDVRYLARGTAGRLRQPTYRGIRADLGPDDVRWE